MSNEDYKLYELIKDAVNCDMKATFEIIIMFEDYINKKCFINGAFNQECKDYVIDKLLAEIKKFKKL